VSEPINPSDEELGNRIRRSMAHYEFAGTVRADNPRPAAQAWRVGALFAAAAAGAVATLVIVALLTGLNTGPSVGNGSPTPSAVPTSTPIAEADARSACLDLGASVPEIWFRPGEDAGAIRALFQALPLLIVDRRPLASTFLYGDSRFLSVCTFRDTGQPERDFSVIRAPRGEHPDAVYFLGGSSSAGAVDALGNPDPRNLPDLLMVGLVADDVARVEVVLTDGSTVEARVAGGYWMAWWQYNVGSVSVRAFGADGASRGEIDAELKAYRPVGPDGIEIPQESPALSPAS